VIAYDRLGRLNISIQSNHSETVAAAAYFPVALALDDARLICILEMNAHDKGPTRNENGDLRPRPVRILFEGGMMPPCR
jgi:hypothetical protein